ncbi:MAG: hypothetical protein NC408_08330 [Candidatus Gastranaerophilales bacterium]|nr:hypothetical protein [Candidatus Gastranaerophilales bacterium]MCM1072315.1 hypothetical protein [Bacteroides sp.]
MPKIKMTTPIVMKALEKMNKPTKITAPDVEPITRSVFDFSTEELGFYKHNGKIINIIFPR